MSFRLLLVLVLAWLPALAQAQAKAKEFKPEVGLPGKDVIWLPAELVMVDKMLDIAKVTPADVVMDLGSGDGRTVIQAARRGARGIGVEFNPDLVEHARQLARREGVSGRVTFERGDLFAADLSRATVITLFLLPSINLKLRPMLLDLKPGTRIVSNTFTMDQWQDDDTASAEPGSGCSLYCVAHLWIVPAKVEGRWKHPQGELVLAQRFQLLSGTLNGAKLTGRLRGEDIVFAADGVEYRGRVSGKAMEGAAAAGRWRAERM
jgi:SAM-dependent methyltransferase